MGNFSGFHWLIIAAFFWFIWKILKTKYNNNSPKNNPQNRKTNNQKSSGDSKSKILKGNGTNLIYAAGVQHHSTALAQAFKQKLEEERKLLDPEDLLDENYTTVESTVSLVYENENQHDSNAVAIKVRNHTIGYLPRGLAPVFREYVAKNKLNPNNLRCPAEIEMPLHDSGEWQVVLDLPFLKPRESNKR